MVHAETVAIKKLLEAGEDTAYDIKLVCDILKPGRAFTLFTGQIMHL